MTDPDQLDDDARFASKLESEMDALRESAKGIRRNDAAPGEDPIDQRVHRAKPVLDLLMEFRDRPELLGITAAPETGNATGDPTCPAPDATPIPNLHQIGRFEIEREIGRGGNGIVMQAWDRQLARRVAIKIPRLAAALSGETKLRFEREAKAAASLNHEGIVAIHEVGHEQGIDFIVSQYIHGRSLADWLTVHTLTPEEAARCIAFLADAIQHAHQRGVLHRDLKPSNVIVEENPHSPIDLSRRCRIVDFGLAAILDDAARNLTNTGAMIGTPSYMSPEQTRLAGDSIGPGTDVYGLGVILYQLLTGNPPFADDDFIRLVEKVRHQEPRSPEKLDRRIPPDLSAIAMKCLEKRATDRYRTAAELRDDLIRFLNGQPVAARPASVANRAKKWVQRNPVATAMIVLLLAGFSITSYAAVSASAADRKSRAAEAVARVEAGTATEVSLFLEDLFQIPKVLAKRQGKLRGKDVTAEQILKHASSRIQNDLDSQPQVKARLMTIIGTSLTEIGEFNEAEQLLREGLELNLDQLKPHDPQLAKSHQSLGKVLHKLDKTSEAESHLEKAIAILQEDVVENHLQLATCYNDLGILLRPTDPQAARDAYDAARELVETYQPDAPDNWALSANIASLDYLGGRYELAVAAYERALESAVRSFGEDHPRVAMLQGNISSVYLKLGQYSKARDYRLRDLEITTRELGKDHVEVANALLGLSDIHRQMGELDAAIQTGRRAIDILEKALPGNHPSILAAINRLVLTLVRTGEFEEALKYAEAIEQADLQRVGDAADFQMLKNQLLLSQVERFNGHYASVSARIESVLNHDLSGRNKAIGTDARIAKALLLAETGDDSAEDAMIAALQYADDANVLRTPDRAYAEAQFWALVGQQERAIEKLEEAIDAGYKDARIFSDPDFRSLQDSQPFQAIVNQLQLQ